MDAVACFEQGNNMLAWRVLHRICENMFILCQSSGSCVRYAPLYIHSFKLSAMRKVLEATRFQQRYERLEEIADLPDKLRWLRYCRGLLQAEVALQLEITEAVYNDLENGVTQRVSAGLADKLADFYGVPSTVFLDEYNRFLCDGQAERIRAYRQKFAMGKKTFARQAGIPLSSLREWEANRKIISRKSWERYFAGKA